LNKALNDLLTDNLIYGRVYINGEQVRPVSQEYIDMIAYFIAETKIRQIVFKYQTFSNHSLEYIARLYNIVLPELKNEKTRVKHWNIIRKIFN